jgi:hypothetical protein
VKKLKVSWQEGTWKPDGDMPIASATVPADARVEAVADTLVFKVGPNQRICLAVPAARLVSAVEVEVAE